MSTTVHSIRLRPLPLRVFALKGEQGAILIDAGTPGQGERILKALRHLGLGPDEIRLILITHGHLDHFGSAAALRETLGASIAIHAADAVALREGVNRSGSMNPTSRLAGLLGGGGPQRIPPLEPDLTFEEAWRLDAYGIAGEVLPTPGHTPGAVSVLLDSGEAIVGDLFGARLLPPRRAAPPFVAADLAQNWESLRRLLERCPRVLHTTHGGAFDLETVAQLLSQQG